MEYQKSFLIIGRVDVVNYKAFFDYVKNNKVWVGYNGVSTFMKPNGESQTFGNIIWHTNLDHSKRHEPLILWQHYYDDQGNPLPDSAEKYPKYDNYDAINVDRVANIPCDYVPCWFKCSYANRCEWAQSNGLEDVKAFCESLTTRERSESATESWASQVHTHSMSTQNNLESLDSPTMLSGMANLNVLQLSKEKQNIVEYLSKKCNGLIGAPSTFTMYVCPEQFEILGNSRYHDNQDFTDDINVINGKAKYMRVLIRRKQREEDQNGGKKE